MRDSKARPRGPHRPHGFWAYLLITCCCAWTLIPADARGQSPGGTGTSGTGTGTGGTGGSSTSGTGSGTTSGTTTLSSLVNPPQLSTNALSGIASDMLDYLALHPNATNDDLGALLVMLIDDESGANGNMVLAYAIGKADPQTQSALQAIPPSSFAAAFNAATTPPIGDPDENTPPPALPAMPNPEVGLPLPMRGYPFVFKDDVDKLYTIGYHRVCEYDPNINPNTFYIEVHFRDNYLESRKYQGIPFNEVVSSYLTYIDSAAAITEMRTLLIVLNTERKVAHTLAAAYFLTGCTAMSSGLAAPAGLGCWASAATLGAMAIVIDKLIVGCESQIKMDLALLKKSQGEVMTGGALPKDPPITIVISNTTSGFTPWVEYTDDELPPENGVNIFSLDLTIWGQPGMRKFCQEEMTVSGETLDEAIQKLPIELRALYRQQVGL